VLRLVRATSNLLTLPKDKSQTVEQIVQTKTN